MHIALEDLKKLLLGSKILTEATFGAALKEAERSGRTIDNVLVGRGDVTEEFLADLLSKYFKVPLVDLQRIDIPRNVLELLPEEFSREHGVLVYAVGEEGGRKSAKVATVDPGDLETISYVQTKLGMPVKIALTTQGGFKNAFRLYRGSLMGEFAKEIEQNLAKVRYTVKEEELTEVAKEIPIVIILDRIITQALVLDASDIHFEPFEDIFLVRLRVDGVLREVLHLPKALASILVARVKVLTSLKIDEHAVPQDGRFSFKYQTEQIDIRISIMPTFWGEKIAMRLLRSSARPVNLAELGYIERDREILEEEIKKTHGMILTTGPTGSGKTTTLYSILYKLNQPGVNIVTIEDPVEYAVTRINQTQVNVQAGLTFGTGLRSFLRQDPNVVLVGEIRDNETTDLAIHAALTGHLVLTTLHTNDAATAIPRLLDLGAQPFLLATTINLAMAQRLARTICSVCIASRPPTAEETKIFAHQAKVIGTAKPLTIPKTLFFGKGCNICNGSGFHGRVGIHELLQVSDPIRQLILDRASSGKIKTQAVSEGMRTMFEDGVEKVERGITTLEELLRVIRE